MSTLPEAWADLPFFTEVYPGILAQLEQDTREILPPEDLRFRALELCPPEAVRVVILGQDPYPTPGHANGLAFAVNPDVSPLPKSLINIYKEMEADVGGHPSTGDLSGIAAQGVLLLNTALTVPAGDAGGHKNLGWDQLAQEVIARVRERPTAFILWGRHAQAAAGPLTDPHLVIATSHPSPLSAHVSFNGSRPFSRVNDWLVSQGSSAIDWAAD